MSILFLHKKKINLARDIEQTTYLILSKLLTSRWDFNP